MRFYDREYEISILQKNELQSRRSAVFTVLRGRKRVGKTTLIKTALNDCEYAYFLISNDCEEALCLQFKQTLEKQLGIHFDGTINQFCDLFEVVMKESLNRHYTIILDEFQMLQEVNPAIFRMIKKLWNRYHNRSHLHLITLCSIQPPTRHIFEDTNGQFYGRPSTILTLKPFTIKVLRQIFHDYCHDYQNEDLLCLFMITGGVPKYVELLMDAGCYTKEKMLCFVCTKDSYFITEGNNIVNQLFGNKSVAYFSVLQLVASSLDTFHNNGTMIQRKLCVYLEDLERNYQMVKCMKPLFTKAKNPVTAYEISDQFLRFWFHFIGPYQSYVEQGQLSLIREKIEEYYNSFTGRTLEQYFRTLAMESGRYTQVGCWWSSKGKYEIDMIALNEMNHTGLVAEIKRTRQNISLTKLKEKANALPPKSFGDYSLTLRALSINDMDGLRYGILNRWFDSVIRFLHRLFRHRVRMKGPLSVIFAPRLQKQDDIPEHQL